MPRRRGRSYAQFKKAVTRYDRDALLLLVAHGSSLWDGQVVGSDGKARILQPWASAAIAYVAIRWGRSGIALPQAETLFELSNMHANLDQPELARGLRSRATDSLHMVERYLYEQTPHQKLTLAAMSRARGLFIDTEFPRHRTPKVFVEGWDQKLFGGSLDHYLASVFLLMSYGKSSGGRWPVAEWDSTLEALSEVISHEQFSNMLNANLTDSIDGLKARMKAAAARRRTQGKPPAPDALEFNPLFARPAVLNIVSGELVIPSLQSLEMKASVQSIVYSGLEFFGTAFSTEVGYLFDAYVGRNLALLGGDGLRAERKYKNELRNSVDSVDWFVVFDSVVVLVEVKAVFPPEDTRMGLGEPMQDYGVKLRKAADQLQKSNHAIQDRLREFDDIPSDRPAIGLVVTMSDFFTLPSECASAAGTPATAYVTIDDLEMWCGLGANEAERVAAAFADGAHGSGVRDFRSCMTESTFLGNAVVDAAFDANPMVRLADLLGSAEA